MSVFILLEGFTRSIPYLFSPETGEIMPIIIEK
jgi:hypothetical protein